MYCWTWLPLFFFTLINQRLKLLASLLDPTLNFPFSSPLVFTRSFVPLFPYWIPVLTLVSGLPKFSRSNSYVSGRGEGIDVKSRGHFSLLIKTLQADYFERVTRLSNEKGDSFRAPFSAKFLT
jgi:hypothetical protein